MGSKETKHAATAAASPSANDNAPAEETVPAQPEQEGRNDENKVTRKDWKALDMPEETETFTLTRHFSEQQMRVLERGHVPEEMEDKWFWYVEDNKLYAHRSWTGYCIYILEFSADDNHKVTVNRFPMQYGCTDIKRDEQSLNSLLNWWVQGPYDYYGEFVEETAEALRKK